MPTPLAHGPDISHYQTIVGPPAPSWKLFSHKMSEGASSGDAQFSSRWKWMRSQPSLKYRAAYHWLRSDSTMAAQAGNVVRRISKEGGLLPGEFIQTDWETTPNIANVKYTDVIEFNDRVQQAFGRECVITYSSDWVPGFTQWRAARPNDPLWYANYNTGSRPQDGWAECSKWGADVWQWTSSYYATGSITSQSGGGFDMNHVFNWSTLDRISGLNQTPPPPPPEDEMAILTTPVRVFDSRSGGAPLQPGVPIAVSFLANRVGVNITVVGASTDGYLTAWGAGPKPATSNVQFQAGANKAYDNFSRIALDEGGVMHLVASSTCHVLIDLQEASS